MAIAALFFLLLAFFLEGTILSLPLVFVVIITMYITFRQSFVFLVALILGVFLDVMLFRYLGQTSLYLLSFLLLLVVYERKFETRTFPFVVFASFIGGVGYLLLFGSVNFFVQVGALVVLAVVFFALFRQGRSLEGNLA